VFVWILESHDMGDLFVYKTKRLMLSQLKTEWYVYKESMVYLSKKDCVEGNEPVFYVHKLKVIGK
jgi:hypothetical protein